VTCDDEIEKNKHNKEEEEQVGKLDNSVILVDTCGFKSNLTNSQELDDDFSNLNENNYSNLSVSGFTKPNIKNLVMFFKFHPIQPYDNVPYNPLIAYFYNNNVEKHKRTWLSYNALNKSFYCTFCLAFSKIDNRFTIGCTFNNKNTYNRIREHEKSNDHQNCVDAYLLQSKEKDIYNFFSVAKKSEVYRKKAVLERIIETIKVIGKRGLSFRGAKDAEAAYTLNDDSLDHGNFLEMLILISKFDTLLKEHIDEAVIKSKKNREQRELKGIMGPGRQGSFVTLLSKTTANYIIDAIGKLMRNSISEDIKRAQFFSIQIDSTQDINVHDQLCVIIRYVTNEVNERLLAVVKSTSGTGESLYNTVYKLLEVSGLDINNCIGSSTDGASNMRGEYNGFSAWLNKKVPEQIHVWCHAHVLNLVMSDTTKKCIESVSFFGLLNAIAVFVRESYLRMNKWEKTSKFKFISVIGETRWWAKDRCVSKIFGSYNNPNDSLFVDIIQTLHAIYTTDTFVPDVRFKAKTYIDALLKYETVVMSQIYLQMFASTTALSLYLQTNGMDILRAYKMVKHTINTLENQSRNFEKVICASNQFVCWANELFPSRELDYCIPMSFLQSRISKKKTMAGEKIADDPIQNAKFRYCVNVYNVIYDQAINSLKQRFSEHGKLFKSMSILEPSGFKDIKNYDHLQISKHLIYLVDILKKFDEDVTVGTLADELFDFAGKWSRIKHINNIDNQDANEGEVNIHVESDSEEDEDLLKKNKIKNKNTCQNCIVCCFNVLKTYNLHTMAYSSLFMAYKFILTLSCTQVKCETTFSKLKYIFNRLRNTLSQEKLDTFLIMNVEKDILLNIKNEDIIHLITNKSDELKNILLY